MMIDSHQHFWQYDPEKYSWVPEGIQQDFSPGDLKPLLLEHDFDGCIAVQTHQSEEETVKLLELGNTFPFIKGVVGWVDLTSENVEDRLDLFSRDPSFKGVRHTVWDEKGEFMKDPKFQRGIAALGKFDLTYDILAFDYQLSSAIELVKTFPEQPFVLDHMGKPQMSKGVSQNWRRNILELGSQTNMFCKISGLMTEAENFIWKASDFNPFLETVVTAFGTDRLMFGSDWPVCLSAATYGEVVEIVQEFFSEEERKKIFGQNAARFYKLTQNDEL
jgi:L-fuconolactonase